jgi:polyvinyl alcohol dehydrogenase (cytochrome)
VSTAVGPELLALIGTQAAPQTQLVTRRDIRKYSVAGILSAVTAIPGAVFAGHMDGRVRAYDSATGKVLWEYDSTGEVKTTSGATAHGGSVGGGGPMVVDGTVYINSGYGIYWHMPGNVLLAFSADGR